MIVSLGVDSSKWNVKCDATVVKEALSAFSALANEQRFDKREAVFAQYRDVLTVIFRKPKDSIPRTVSVFWKDPQHLAFHFSFLTGAEPLNKAIMQRYKDQFKNIEVFVKNYGSSKTKENLAKIEEDCQIEHNGASTWKEINLLVI